MRNRMKRFVACAVLLFASVAFGQLKLIPTPQKIEMKQGRFAVGDKDAPAVRVTHLEKPINASAGDESYQLNISPDGIEIRSSADAGEYYARQTLKQLIRANSDANHT